MRTAGTTLRMMLLRFPPTAAPLESAILFYSASSNPRNERSCGAQIFSFDRETPHTLTGGRENCIRDRWRNRRHSRLSHTGGLLRAGNDIALNFRRLKHPHHWIIVKIALLHATLVQRDFCF